MNDAEKALVKGFLHEVVDKYMAEFVAAEEGRLPAAYAGVAQIMAGALLPQFQAFLDAKIDAIGA